MAKKVKTKKTKEKNSKKNITPDLPQNIVPVGERVLDNKNIYIHQKVYAQIHDFAATKTENEHGGILVGRVLNEMGKENTIIEGFIEAKYNNATPTTLTFTHDTWEYFHNEIDRKYKDKKIVGWIHTHPNFGIFLSENDRFIQQNFFTDVNQVAYVVDPIQNEEGFYFWVDEKLESCPGFYLFDKNGVKIKQQPWGVTDEDGNSKIVITKTKTNPAFAIIISIILAFNLIITAIQADKISKLQKDVDDLTLILQYAMTGYATDEDMLSPIVDNLREQIEIQKKMAEEAKKKAMEEAEASKEQPQEEATAEPEAETVEEAQPQAQ